MPCQVKSLAVLFDEKLIKLLLRFVSIIQENRSVPYGLLDTIATDIHSTTCNVVRSRHTPYPFIQLWTTITTIYYNR